MGVVKVLEGSEAVALAVKACRPQVISAYPISPQTHIVESLARMAADGELETQYVRVESEFSAASVISGASAAGSLAYTASSSQGLLLMTEVLYASVGMRLPFVITGVNRQISAPHQYPGGSPGYHELERFGRHAVLCGEQSGGLRHPHCGL